MPLQVSSGIITHIFLFIRTSSIVSHLVGEIVAESCCKPACPSTVLVSQPTQVITSYDLLILFCSSSNPQTERLKPHAWVNVAPSGHCNCLVGGYPQQQPLSYSLLPPLWFQLLSNILKNLASWSYGLVDWNSGALQVVNKLVIGSHGNTNILLYGSLILRLLTTALGSDWEGGNRQ